MAKSRSLWAAREASLQLISGALAEDSEGVEGSIGALGDIAAVINEMGSTTRSRVTALLVAKGQRLGIGAYSMALDCVGQEAGALMRPLQEIYELLEYIREDPKRADQIAEGKKPRVKC